MKELATQFIAYSSYFSFVQQLSAAKTLWQFENSGKQTTLAI
jgi:hypothetical protein